VKGGGGPPKDYPLSPIAGEYSVRDFQKQTKGVYRENKSFSIFSSYKIRKQPDGK
jgi:hypothetical protein